MKNVNWNSAGYKDWVGLSAAPVFWIASLVCFVLGLSFRSGTGYLIPGTQLDWIILFSVGLGFANTAIQIVGNDTDREELGMALVLMWGASYMLGIGSNINFLYGVIGLSNGILQFLVCWGLGIMIEVAPERLLVKFLRSVGVLKPTSVVTSQPRQVPPSNLPRRMPDNAPGASKPTFKPQPRIVTTNQEPFQRPVKEPTYHPVSYMEGDDLPDFIKARTNERTNRTA
jgi:hypothetical protein